MKNVLIKLPGLRVPVADLRAVLKGVLSAEALRTADIQHGADSALTYAYLQLPAGDMAAQCQALQQACGVLHARARAIALQCTLDLQGYSFGSKAGWHYVVETDVRPQAEDDFNAWYRREHMPGLAAVPGTVRAWRYTSGESPRHYAAYDLETLETFGSAPWLAVRASDWSGRVRPNFFNTTRTMFKKAVDPADSE